MKKYITTIALLLTLGVFACLTHADTSAKELPQIEIAREISDSKKSGIEKLADAIILLAQTLKGDENENVSGLSLQSVYWDNPTCVSDWDTWENSGTRKTNISWDTNKFPANNIDGDKNRRNFIDMNGDGLLDFLYYYTYAHQYNGHFMHANSSCVLLNNGEGWDTAYRCVSNRKEIDGVYHTWYYGDCADMTP